MSCKRIALGVPLAVVLSFAAAALADAGGPGRGRRHHHERRNALRQLNLTEDQKAQMKALREQQHEKAEPKMDEMMKAHEALRTEVFSDNPNAAQIDALKARISGLQSETLAAHVDFETKVARILTPEQRKKMTSLPHPPFGLFMRRVRHHEPQDGPEREPR
jgi:Spy/CpxP family protein refolding chaperone